MSSACKAYKKACKSFWRLEQGYLAYMPCLWKDQIWLKQRPACSTAETNWHVQCHQRRQKATLSGASLPCLACCVLAVFDLLMLVQQRLHCRKHVYKLRVENTAVSSSHVGSCSRFILLTCSVYGRIRFGPFLPAIALLVP